MYDAQKAYQKLEEHHQTSNTAMFAAHKKLWHTLHMNRQQIMAW
jgi:hypothetical protein